LSDLFTLTPPVVELDLVTPLAPVQGMLFIPLVDVRRRSQSARYHEPNLMEYLDDHPRTETPDASPDSAENTS
jgi:hypothetical protein